MVQGARGPGEPGAGRASHPGKLPEQLGEDTRAILGEVEGDSQSRRGDPPVDLGNLGVGWTRDDGVHRCDPERCRTGPWLRRAEAPNSDRDLDRAPDVEVERSVAGRDDRRAQRRGDLT